ncbi:Tubulin-folding cofactor D [Hyphodiscus hymeniophilus]|uniref:Tubulin-folding cofactor D n=1 Tax=Hyphodiscus hymeniophilus TaxID=353542 RepID=A0A9P6VJK3_9HELO|nr:Tubulin-folding cofactor D [Hyphodiscus hymeniophilus]
MDAPEDDQDVKLQRASHELLADLGASLNPFLWKRTQSGRRKIRRRVRVREADRLVALLEPFQENPQLLDPHLADLVPILADAFLACVISKAPSKPPPQSQLLMSTSRATCRLIYTFCKVRGDKVIVRFLSTEAKHLEMLLSAIETQSKDEDGESDLGGGWEWEERYIALLWLSQLLFAPFDLASISSQAGLDGTQSDLKTTVPGLVWPSKIPSIAMRTIPLTIHYLSTSSKERDAAKVLLVRVAMRRDMQELGVMDALVKWAISRLRHSSIVEQSTYYYIGILSFIAGILKSSIGTADINAYLSTLFDVMQRLCSAEDDFSKTINASPIIRQTSVNILRNISALLLRSSGILGSSEMVEWVIGYLLDSLGDSATPVRIATSKALSLITLKLAPEMAEQVIEEIMNALRKDILGVTNKSSVPDLSTVNPLQWHGLILTLSQLLYRRAPPPDQLEQIISALIDGVNFEQRSTSGSSVGTNVRDAANLGIWAIARRYTTKELQTIRTKSSSASAGRDDVLQRLAAVLIISATLDPAGNIRRGSSAALQELIGRHPNTIIEGIQLVQTVEYSSVALRSKAMQEIAIQAAALDQVYAKSLLTALETWRGVGDPDVSARRIAAATFGTIACRYMARDTTEIGDEHFWATYCGRINSIVQRLNRLQHRQVEERHGLILCLAATVRSVEEMFLNERATQRLGFPTTYIEKVLSDLRKLLRYILEDAKTSTYRRPELVAEAVCQLLIAVSPLLGFQNRIIVNDPRRQRADLAGNPDVLSTTSDTVRLIDLAGELLGKWLRRNEPEVIEAASTASCAIFSLHIAPKQDIVLSNWVNIITEDQGSRTGQDLGVLSTLFKVFNGLDEVMMKSMRDSIMQAARTRWNLGHDIESRVAILQNLASSGACLSNLSQVTDMISEGLDDYTTDARGDVGSLVRTEALKAAAKVWKAMYEVAHEKLLLFDRLFPKVLRLAAEKLDKVRSEAQKTVNVALSMESTPFGGLSPSSKEYFRALLDMPDLCNLIYRDEYVAQWQDNLLEGLVTSADTGSEDLVRASRAALAEFCEIDNAKLDSICVSLISIMKRNLKNDRVLVPTMEVVGYLFEYRIMQRSSTNWRNLYALIQNAHYQSGNMRKLEAAVKLYGGLLDVYPGAAQKLSSMLLHKYPKVRNEAADTLFVKRGVGKSVNWIKAKQVDLVKLREAMEGGAIAVI